VIHRLVPIVGAALTLAVVGSALAHAPVVLDDPNDTRGPMDVMTVAFDDAGDPTFTVRLEKPWRTRATWDRAFVFVYLDVLGSPRGDYYVIVRSTGDDVIASLWRDARRGSDVRVRPIEVMWRSPREVTVSVRLAVLDVGPLRSVYRWWVVTTFSGEVCRMTCIDRAPDEGGVEQQLPGASPTPTPTPSPTPTTGPRPGG